MENAVCVNERIDKLCEISACYQVVGKCRQRTRVCFRAIGVRLHESRVVSAQYLVHLRVAIHKTRLEVAMTHGVFDLAI